ncbi:hypothetical protein ACFOM8_16320 [Paracoccus angustae]|uniref:Uncharacterized protein n=1 Tax=Paracoccus angustae TaxID=1671480 RepID=A0ABV7U7S0_9RHOB
MDGVQILTGGHLMGQFLSPRTNPRTDSFWWFGDDPRLLRDDGAQAIRPAAGCDFVMRKRQALVLGVADLEGGNGAKDFLGHDRVAGGDATDQERVGKSCPHGRIPRRRTGSPKPPAAVCTRPPPSFSANSRGSGSAQPSPPAPWGETN